jgi:NAD kinase
MKLENILVVYYVHNYSSLKKVEQCLKEHRLAYTAVRRENLHAGLFRKRDLIITVGGDGTFLKAARFAGNVPVLCVSSEPRYNEGFFARADTGNIEKKFALILKGKSKITELARLEGTFKSSNDKLTAINEIFIGSSQPHHTSRYILQVGSKKEFQKSSGVIVATPAGSHAWAKSAGAKPLSLSSRKFLYVVREPYIGRLTKSRLTFGILGEKQKIRIISNIRNGIAVSDSQSTHRFGYGEVIEIKKSSKNLRMVDF